MKTSTRRPRAAVGAIGGGLSVGDADEHEDEYEDVLVSNLQIEASSCCERERQHNAGKSKYYLRDTNLRRCTREASITADMGPYRRSGSLYLWRQRVGHT